MQWPMIVGDARVDMALDNPFFGKIGHFNTFDLDDIDDG